MATTYSNRLRADELRHEVGIRGVKMPEAATVGEMRTELSRLLREEEAGAVLGPDALLPIDQAEEQSILEAKLAEVETAVAELSLEADASTAARARALISHCNKRLSRLLGYVDPGGRKATKKLLVQLKAAITTFRGVGPYAVYQASSVGVFSDPTISSSSSPSVHTAPSGSETSASVSGSSHSTTVSTVSTTVSKGGPRPKSKKSKTPPMDFSKWGIKFSAQEETSVISFIMDVEAKAESMGVSKRQLFKGASAFFEGNAKTWWRSSSEYIDSWEELKKFLQTEFLPVGYLDNLWDEARNRLQGENESIGVYVANMLMLFKRLAVIGPVDEELKLNIITKNLAPFYLKGIAHTPILSIPHLKQVGRNLELVKYRVERYDNPSKCLLMEPEFACKSKARPRARLYEIDASEVREPEVAAVSSEGARGPLCWRCDRRGHRFADCKVKGEFRRFCWECGKKDTVKQNCERCKWRRDRQREREQENGGGVVRSPNQQ